MTLEQFENGLVRVIGQPSALRPFVCEGSPLTSEVFIVGYNPATELEGDWWRFWRLDYGFQKRVWKKDYLKQRAGKMSRTRKRIENIVAELGTVRVLEANIDARPSRRKSDYPRPVTAPFDYLLTACAPQVIIAHGVNAVAYLQDWAKNGKLIESPHFIYVGRARTANIVAETRDALAARNDNT